jgi:hypothetical protein
MTLSDKIIVACLIAYPIGAFIVFITCYIYDHMKNDLIGLIIGFWPIFLPIMLGAFICRKIQKYWVIIGGPKIRKLGPNRQKQEHEDACENLRMSIRYAHNANVPNEEIIRIIVRTKSYDARQGMPGEEVIQIVKDIMVKDVMES